MAKDDSSGTRADQFNLRLPDGMRDRIRDAAEANNRSMNAEIVATLEEKYPAFPPYAPWVQAMVDFFKQREAGELSDSMLERIPAPYRKFLQFVEKEMNRPFRMERRHRRAWVEGQQAAKTGQPESVNPYEEDDQRADVWAEGYRNPDYDPFFLES